MNTPLQQAAQELVDRIADLGASPLDWAEYTALEKAIADEQAQAVEPVAWMHEGALGRYFNENRNDVHSIPLYCAPMTHDSDFIQIPVAYQYAYPDGAWRCSYGDEINGSRPITSRALYARKDSQ